MKFKSIAIVVGLFVSVLYSQPLNAGVYDKHIAELRKKAESGDADSAQELGGIYTYGIMAEKDEAEAVKWYSKALKQYRNAAERGDVEAQFKLGRTYMQGWGVNKDEAECIKWYLKAAGQGHAIAQRMIGSFYWDGYGYLPQNKAEAVQWYIQASGRGDTEAQYRLGYSYENGVGVTKDWPEAVKWYSKSAVRGNAEAQYRVGYIFYMDNKKDLAVKWLQMSAKQWNTDAIKLLKTISEQ